MTHSSVIFARKLTRAIALGVCANKTISPAGFASADSDLFFTDALDFLFFEADAPCIVLVLFLASSLELLLLVLISSPLPIANDKPQICPGVLYKASGACAFLFAKFKLHGKGSPFSTSIAHKEFDVPNAIARALV